MTQNSWSVGFKDRFDPQTGNLALSQPKIPMAVVCWVAVDPQPESPLRNREILCPRAVADSSELFLPCPKPQGLYTVFIFHVSAVPIPTHLHCVAPFFRLKNIWSPKNSGISDNKQPGWPGWPRGTHCAGGHGGTHWRSSYLKSIQDMLCCRWAMGLYMFGKINRSFSLWNMGIGQNWVPQCTPIIRCLIPNIY